jgi:phage regulator Rha-like protein
MNINILNYENEKVVSSLQIAENLDLQHESLQRLITKYISKLELFGVVRFEIGAKNKKTFYLNENQALFLGTLSKNTELVVEFKNALVTAFSNLKEIKQEPTKELTTIEILELTTNEIKRLKSQLETTTKTLEYKQSIIVDMAEKVPAKTMRAVINQSVRNYHEKTHLAYSYIWNNLYTEFKYVYHIDLEARVKGTKTSKIAMAEKIGVLEDLYLLTLKMYETEKQLIKIS